MPTLDHLFGPHSVNLNKALTQASRRHSLLTQNLANVNTPGYKRQDVDFSIALERAEGDRPDALARVRQLRLSQATSGNASLRADGNSVDLEAEAVAIADTQLRYQLLTELTGRYFSGLKNVIREGR